MLQNDFVVGWKNIVQEDYVGRSHGYDKDQLSVGTTNGAGPHNVQMFVLSADKVVMHALPGFWHPEDLAHELRFAKVLHRLWKDKKRTRAEKRELFSRMQLAELRYQPKLTTARSGWQGFDAANERKRTAAGKQRDTFVEGRSGRVRMKPINVLVHERMAKRPFVRFKDFDTAVFADYGRKYYDNNARVDGRGVTVNARRKNESPRQRRRRQLREAAAREKEAKRRKEGGAKKAKRRRPRKEDR